MNLQKLPIQNQVDFIQHKLSEFPAASTKLTHRFTPGLYIRELFVPAGTMVVTKIHKTEHPFVVSCGRCSVWTEEDGIMEIEAPFTGITKPGTRRIVFVHSDTVWTTFHPTHETDVDAIESQIIEPRDITLELQGTMIQLMEAK